MWESGDVQSDWGNATALVAHGPSAAERPSPSATGGRVGSGCAAGNYRHRIFMTINECE